MKIAITGGSGLIGSAVVRRLRAAGHDVVTLVRRDPAGDTELRWDPAGGSIDRAGLIDVEAVVHLAGAGIADHRWTPSYKALVKRSRVEGTTLIARTVAAMDPRPRVLLSGSAIGWYGDTGDQIIDETAPRGEGFLAEVVGAWEGSTAVAESAGVRTVHLRTGLVLSADGGYLAKQVLPFKAGLGGPIAGGRQWQSWITLDDEVGAIEFLLAAEQVRGPVNLTAPSPVRQKDFARALGHALHRPALTPLPRFALRAALGEFADEGVVASQRIEPAVLSAAGYPFLHRNLDGALAAVLAT